MYRACVAFLAAALMACQPDPPSPERPEPPGAARWLHPDTLAVCQPVHYTAGGRGQYLGEWVSPEQRAFMERTGFTQQAGHTTPRSVHPDGKVKMVCRRYVRGE